MIYLGIDQSYTSTGCVVIDSDKNLLFHTTITSNIKDDIITRARFITDNISEVVREWKPKKIALEGLSFSSKGNATRDLGGLMFLIVNKISFDMNYEVIVVAPPTLKKHATNSGRAKKEDMFNCLPNPIHCEFIINYKKTKGLYDVTDAYWLADYLLK